MWNRKVILSPKQHGKINQLSPMMVTWFNNTRININYRNWLDNKEQKELEGKKNDKNLKKYWRNLIPLDKYPAKTSQHVYRCYYLNCPHHRKRWIHRSHHGGNFVPYQQTHWLECSYYWESVTQSYEDTLFSSRRNSTQSGHTIWQYLWYCWGRLWIHCQLPRYVGQHFRL
jgi:hypothetical protein